MKITMGMVFLLLLFDVHTGFSASTEKYILVNINQYMGDFCVKNSSMVDGKIDYEQKINEGAYYGKIVSKEGSLIGYFPAREMFSMVCSKSFKVVGWEGGAGCMISLKIPLILGGETAEIFSPQGKKILTIDLPQW